MLVSLIIMSSLLLSQQSMKDDKHRLYGSEFSKGKVVSIKDALSHPDTYDEQIVTIEATVSSVCEMKGCWMYVTDGAYEIRVNFKDYAFFVPYDSPGKQVKIQGKIYKKIVDKNTLKHWAEDSKKHWAEDSKSADTNPKDFSEDKLMVLFEASGVLIEGGSPLSEEQKEAISGEKE